MSVNSSTPPVTRIVPKAYFENRATLGRLEQMCQQIAGGDPRGARVLADRLRRLTTETATTQIVPRSYFGKKAKRIGSGADLDTFKAIAFTLGLRREKR